MNYKFKRLTIVKGLIQDNIKMLEDRKIAKIDKEISRDLINEEVDCLIKDFLFIKKFGNKKQFLRFKSDMREIRDMLFSYLLRHHDNDIYQAYTRILIII